MRSELSNFRDGQYTKCSNHAYTGASIPSESMKHYSPSFRKPCYKRERGVRPMWTHVDRGEGVINLIPFVDVINGWPLIPSDLPPFLFNFPPILQVSPIFRCSYVLTLNLFSSHYQNVTFPSP